MPVLLLASIDYSGYISPVKLLVFLALFFSWVALVGWVYRDSEAVDTKQVLWTAIVLGGGAGAILLWFVMPLFIIGVVVFLLAAGGSAISYVIHRNARVMDHDKVLTADHFRRLLSSEQSKLRARQGVTFITANGNEVPVPAGKTADFFGYTTAIDVFTDALWRRAMAIVYSPAPENYNVIYYVDGVGLKQPPAPRDQMEYFINFVKNLGDLDIGEKRKPQKGKFKIKQGEKSSEWELITAGSRVGEQLRLSQKTQEDIKNLSDIGLASDQFPQVGAIREAPQGLFIVSGPPKTGVTSTLYAMLRNHDPFLFSINTLERKLSGELANMTQHVFTLSDTGTTTFAKKLQEIIRMGPDIVGVADCEDSESSQMACKAGSDGKIIYASLKAESVIKALGKWKKLVGDDNLVAEPLLGISNQRLLRKLCDECKQGYEPDRGLLKKFNLPADKVKVLYRAGKVQYDKHGKAITCENCQGTGFYGRIAVFEIIMMNDPLRTAVKQAKSLSEIAAQFRSAKMLSLQQQALRRVIAGVTSINELIRVFSPASQKQKARRPEQKAKSPQKPDLTA